MVGGAWGMSKMKRAQKEQAIKTALGGCLTERGFDVAAWEKTGRKVPKAATAKAAPPASQGDKSGTDNLVAAPAPESQP